MRRNERAGIALALALIVSCGFVLTGCGDDESIVDTGPEPIPYDGYIAYINDYGVAIIQTDGTDMNIKVNGDPDSLLSPIWSQDKTELVFVRIVSSGEKQIELLRNDGSLDTLAFGMIDKSPWSPNGNRITFTRGDTVWVVGTDGSQPVYLMASAGEANFLDNDHIVCRYFFGDWQTGSIYKVPVSGGTPEKLSTSQATAYAWLMCPRVAPGGGSVAFVKFDDDNFSKRWNDFWMVDADGSDERKIATIYTSWGLLVLVKEMDVSSDGLAVLLVHNEEHSNRHAYEIYAPTGNVVIIDAVECSSDIRSIDYGPDTYDFVFEKAGGGIAIFERLSGQARDLDILGKHPNW